MKPLLLALVLMLAGCSGTPNPPLVTPPANNNDSTNSTGVVATPSTFSAGIAVVFRSPPSPEIVALLNAAAAARESDRVYLFEKYDRFNDRQNTALEASLRAGATLTRKEGSR